MATKRKTKKKQNRFPLLFILSILVAPIAGAVVFNIDRMDYLAEQRHVLKQFLPGWMKRFLPENLAEYAILPPGSEIEARVIEVYDGDTITVLSLDEKTKYRIRLFGVDAPEAEQEFGDEARLALHRKIYGQQVSLAVEDNDIYQRAVAKVYCDNLYINLAMVNEGYAWYYHEYAPRQLDLPLAEEQAKSRHLGLWGKKNPQPPWEYRKSQSK